MLSFKVSVGTSSVTLEKEKMARLGLREGDTLYLTEEADGNFRLSRTPSDHERQMALAKKSWAMTVRYCERLRSELRLALD